MPLYCSTAWVRNGQLLSIFWFQLAYNCLKHGVFSVRYTLAMNGSGPLLQFKVEKWDPNLPKWELSENTIAKFRKVVFQFFSTS